MPRVKQPHTWWRPRFWGISARSALVSASVVLVALAVAGAGLSFVLYRSLLSGIDDAAAGRVRDIAAALQSDGAEELDAALLTTDQRVVSVQVVDGTGAVVRSSQRAGAVPVVSPDLFGAQPRIGLPDHLSPNDDMRISGETVQVADGRRYTILVGAGSEAVESTVKTVLALLAGAAPLVVVVAGAVTYWLVKRSLRSVDVIRARVSAISSSDLGERVPVPASADEITALAVTMNEMLARIQSGHEAQRRFVGDASHELRSPVAAILSALDVVAAHPELLGEHLTSSLLRSEATRMQSLVDDLLLLARADERGLPVRRVDVDLDDLASQELDRVARETRLHIVADLVPTRVIGDPGGLTRVVRNLLDNAARHAASRIEVRVRTEGDVAVFSVADDGPGIPPDKRARIFDRFVRLDQDRSRAGGGTGLGLAIVSEVVAAHQGSVSVGDRAGGGAVFCVQLPLRYSPESSR